MIILDMGSGNTCQNDKAEIRKMIDAIYEVDQGNYAIVLKWQLFKEALPNIPLTHECFEFAYQYGNDLGYQTTASVFDIESLEYLKRFDVLFIKIACRPDLYSLIKRCDKHSVIVSSEDTERVSGADWQLACIRKYPASIHEYEQAFDADQLRYVSDHTVGWKLYHKYNPVVIEKHFVHERRAGNPDAGLFAVTPEELAEVL